MKKILFIHQGPHSVHGEFASTVTDNWKRYGEHYPEIFLNLFKSIFADTSVDYILCEGGLGLPQAVLYKIKNPKIKIILLSADTLFYDLPQMNFLLKRIVKFLLSYVDTLISISDLNQKLASRFIPSIPSYTVYPYGANNHFGINCNLNSNKLLFIGNEESCKRYDLLVESVKILNQDKRRFELYLVGSCITEVPEEYPWLHKEGIQTDLKPYFEKCSLYVHPSDFDSCPVTVFEAMSAGMIPLITDNVGEAAILKENQLEELVLKTNKPEELAEYILNIYSKEDDWKEKVSKYCKELSSSFNKESQKSDFFEKFQRLIGELEP